MLIAKLQAQAQQKKHTSGERPIEVPWKRIEDVEMKLGIIVGQLEEEKEEINHKL